MYAKMKIHTKSIYESIKVLMVFCAMLVVPAQKSVNGIVTDSDLYPINDVKITVGDQITFSDSHGVFSISYTDESQIIVFEKEGFVSFEDPISELSLARVEIILMEDYESGILRPIEFYSTQKKDMSSVEISGEKAEVLPSISGGVEDLLKSLPSINSNTELSSQYMVRGGNYDENLIYINNVEVYKPLLARSGQQEGYSIVNPAMVNLLNFSAGGFEASYGDRMSSVLDIYYKRPKSNYVEVEASLINAALTTGLTDKKNKLTALIGGRFRDTDLLLNTLDGDTDFNPRYFDVQSYLTYKLSPKFDMRFLGTFSQNDFEMEPKERQTTFGTLFQPIQLSVLYNGRENDQFITENASLQFNYQPQKKIKLQFAPYYFHSMEEEYFDIAAGYALQELDPASGQPVVGYDAGGQINHARNDLDLRVLGAQIRMDYDWNVNRTLSWGMKFQREEIEDFQTEWQLIDSVGYSIPRPPYSIGELDGSDLLLDYYVSSRVQLKSQRINGFIQYEDRYYWGDTKVLLNAGIRATYWDFNKEFDLSPRVQLSLKPNWSRNMHFRIQTGLYYQPPFYKEIRRLDGTINPDIRSQQSFHFIVSNDYFLDIWERPFKLTTEAYYKAIKHLIPYFIDNVRIKYTGENNAKGKMYGIESRLNGEFIPGVESWVALSYARAYQNIDNRGDLPLPTDPRFKASLFFQDEMKFWPSMKAAINFIYASGLPNGAPLFTDPYLYQSTLSAYRRVDVSLTKIFVDEGRFKKSSGFFSNLKQMSLSLDVFNIFNISNTVSNQWIRDLNSGLSYAVPNRLTGRFFNLKLRLTF